MFRATFFSPNATRLPLRGFKLGPPVSQVGVLTTILSVPRKSPFLENTRICRSQVQLAGGVAS